MNGSFLFFPGMFQWKSVGYCLGVVLIAFALTFKGIMVIEKVVYWSLIFAAVEFTIILYCSLIQHGSGSGLIYIFHWKWSLFKDKKPWIICFQHVIHANGLGCGKLFQTNSAFHSLFRRTIPGKKI